MQQEVALTDKQQKTASELYVLARIDGQPVWTKRIHEKGRKWTLAWWDDSQVGGVNHVVVDKHNKRMIMRVATRQELLPAEEGEKKA